jgi:hypothetical protein
MTCLKYLARCPCPRCLTLKSSIPRLGMETDKNARQKLIRTDSKAIQDTVNRARRMMFEDGINITSVFIERLLKPQSLVPTRVSSITKKRHGPDLSISRMRFHFDSLNMDSIFIKCSSRISCTSLSLVYGRQCLPTCCVFCMRTVTTPFPF